MNIISGVIICLLLGLVSRLEESPTTDAPFSQPVMQLLEGWKECAVPVLPEPDNWDLLDSPRSATPGRMHLPKNIIIDKPNTRLYVVNVFGDTLSAYRVCASLKRGQKQKADDWRTPEGSFGIVGVYNSTDWTYKDTNDKCYGPFFISLITPRFWGIGIHGTNSPASVPGRRSHGCIRMHNEDIVRVRRMVDKDSRVLVMPDPEQPDAASEQ